MESNINLESLKEISNSQLEALLRYDSPPETPAQSIDPTSLDEDLNKSQNDIEATSINTYPNRHQFVSQMDSQIDFSIFNNFPPNDQWSLSPLNMPVNENDHFVIANSLLNSDDIPDTRDGNRNLEDDIFMEFNETENNYVTNSSTNKIVKGEALSETECIQNEECNFEEVDNIFRQIEYMSNLHVNRIKGWNGPNCLDRKCQTQVDMKTALNDSNKKVIYSCPVNTTRNSPHSNALYSTNFRRGNLSAKIQDHLQFNSKTLPNTSQKEEENKSIIDDQICLSFDKNLNDNMVEVDSIFKEPHCEYNLVFSGIAPNHQSQDQSKTNTNLNTTPKNYTNLNMMADASAIPVSVKQLYEIVKTDYSDFAFIYALSSQLCQDRVPMECFVTLKMALLLSLASIGNNKYRPPISIVAMANDTYMTDYLMSNIGQLGSRFLGPVDEAKSFSSTNWIEADCVLLARGGVYYAGDWTRLKLRKAETIFKNIECSNVAVEKSSLNFPLETAIWTHWRSFKFGVKDQQTFNKFLKIFGIPIFVSDDNHEALIDYTLEQSSIRIFESTVDHLSINEDDMRNFLIYVSRNNVDLSPEAALLLKNYFVACRSKRQDCLSNQSYAVLKQFAESFAKLSMRKVVSSDDAIAAIIICEHFIESVFSSSDSSPPHFGNFTFIGTVDKYVTQFKKWVDSYIEDFTNE